MAEETSVKHKPGWRSIFLGLFVLGQIVFLSLANLIQFVPREMPEQMGEFDIHIQREGRATDIPIIQAGINAVGTALDRYGEFSGQVQAWSLFAPDFGKQSVYPVVICFRGEGLDNYTLTLMPKIVPEDRGNYFRWPGPYDRIFSYEFLLAFVYWHYNDKSLAEHGEQWRKQIRDRVRQQRKSLETYFRWNLRMMKLLDPDGPQAREMILYVRIDPSPAPGQTDRPRSTKIPLARWVPDRAAEPEFLPIEAFDPVAKRFIRLAIEEGR